MAQSVQYCFLVCFQHIMSEQTDSSNVFLALKNNPGVLHNSTEHSKPLFIAFRQSIYSENTQAFAVISVWILTTAKNQSDCQNFAMSCVIDDYAKDGGPGVI